MCNGFHGPLLLSVIHCGRKVWYCAAHRTSSCTDRNCRHSLWTKGVVLHTAPALATLHLTSSCADRGCCHGLSMHHCIAKGRENNILNQMLSWWQALLVREGMCIYVVSLENYQNLSDLSYHSKSFQWIARIRSMILWLTGLWASSPLSSSSLASTWW